MNADPAGTRSPHLDLGDLIGQANGQPVGGADREHLACCERCQLEASRWRLVADGVRGLAAAEAAPASVPALPAHPRRTGRRVLARPWRHALLAAGSAAAALVLLLGVGAATGLVHVRLDGPGHSTETVLTAVSGCTALKSARGTLEQVNGGSLVIRTASGQPLTVTTTAATEAAEVGASGSLLADITDGASVTLWGPSSDGTIAAFFVIIANPAQQHPQPPPGMAVVKGTVADASTAGFTVVTPGATRVPVTTSGNTAVSVLNVSLRKLPAGASILALGSAGPDGTLSAAGVVAILAPPPAGPAAGPPVVPPGGSPGGRRLPSQVHVQTPARGQVHVKNCSPAAVDEVLAAGG